MNKPFTSCAESAQAMAGQFQVTQLEPRLENSWGPEPGPVAQELEHPIGFEPGDPTP